MKSFNLPRNNQGTFCSPLRVKLRFSAAGLWGNNITSEARPPFSFFSTSVLRKWSAHDQGGLWVNFSVLRKWVHTDSRLPPALLTRLIDNSFSWKEDQCLRLFASEPSIFGRLRLVCAGKVPNSTRRGVWFKRVSGSEKLNFPNHWCSFSTAGCSPSTSQNPIEPWPSCRRGKNPLTCTLSLSLSLFRRNWALTLIWFAFIGANVCVFIVSDL